MARADRAIHEHVKMRARHGGRQSHTTAFGVREICNEERVLVQAFGPFCLKNCGTTSTTFLRPSTTCEQYSSDLFHWDVNDFFNILLSECNGDKHKSRCLVPMKNSRVDNKLTDLLLHSGLLRSYSGNLLHNPPSDSFLKTKYATSTISSNI